MYGAIIDLTWNDSFKNEHYNATSSKKKTTHFFILKEVYFTS